MTFCVYVHMKPDLTPFYVGKGRLYRAHKLSPSVRRKWHGKIIAKYGRKNIIVETHICISEKEAFYRERMTIKALREAGVQLCNLTDGGEGSSGYIPTHEHIEKIRAKAIGRKPSKETIERVAAAHRGMKRSDVACRNMSEAQKGKKRSPTSVAKAVASRRGKPLSEEHKRNVSVALTGRKVSDEHKQKVAAFRLGTIGVSKDGVYKMVRPEVVDEFFENGWKRGKPK